MRNIMDSILIYCFWEAWGTYWNRCPEYPYLKLRIQPGSEIQIESPAYWCSIEPCCCCCCVASVVSDSVWPHKRQPTRLPHPWDSPGKNTGVGCHFLLQCMEVKSESEVAQLCLTLRDPMDCSLPGSSVHGICQAGVLEWGVIAFSNNGMLLSHKKEWYWVICRDLDGSSVCHTEWSHTENNRYHILTHVCQI